jgi:hypothetical protein
VTQGRRGLSRTAVLSLAVLALTACSGADPVAEPSPASGTPPSGSTSPAPEPEKPVGLETPATSAGSLTRRSFPRPHTLGTGWRYAVDPGDAEEGYLGNGTPALERDPREIVQLAVPFGCARRSPMPGPTHALEVDYTARGVKVIAIRGEFGDTASAEAFFTGRAANLDRCRGRSGGLAIGTIVARTDRLGDGVLLSDRTPGSDPWAELAVLDGDQVVLVAAQTTLDRPPMTRAGARRLVPLFRR